MRVILENRTNVGNQQSFFFVFLLLLRTLVFLINEAFNVNNDNASKHFCSGLLIESSFGFSVLEIIKSEPVPKYYWMQNTESESNLISIRLQVWKFESNFFSPLDQNRLCGCWVPLTPLPIVRHDSCNISLDSRPILISLDSRPILSSTVTMVFSCLKSRMQLPYQVISQRSVEKV